jgi:hypothetical protein
MPAYAVLEPPTRQRSADSRSDRVVFLRESFSVAAFLFGPLWMIWRRQWLVLILYLVVLGAVELGLRRLAVPLSARLAVYFLIQILVGIEAASLRRWTLIRHGWRDCGVVIGDDLDLAERRFFDARLAPMLTAIHEVPPGMPPLPPRTAVHGPGPEVTGLFPEPGRGGAPKGAI